jgi:hypothetical protein
MQTNKSLLIKIFFISISMILPVHIWASNGISAPILLKKIAVTDTTAKQENPVQKEKGREKQDEKPIAQKPEVITVPKARKQSRPTVVKPNIKVKPIKVIRPKIKKP